MPGPGRDRPESRLAAAEEAREVKGTPVGCGGGIELEGNDHVCQ
jgi:hypothetical protein